MVQEILKPKNHDFLH